MPFKDPEKARAYQKDYQARWHQDHKTERLAALYQRKQEVYWYVQDLKEKLSCAECGFSHPAALQFHHRNKEEKLFNISSVMKNKISLEKVKAEIRKCIVLCANCHAIHHWNERRGGIQSTGSSIAEQVATVEEACIVTREEQLAYEAVFGTSGDSEQEYNDYLDYYGTDPRRRER